MGIIDLKNLGTISGKIGPYVGYVSKSGKQVLRKHIIPKDPHTPKQLAYRMRFGLVNKGLSPLNNVIKRGFPHNDNAYRSTVSKVLRDAVLGEYPDYRIDYSKIMVAEGKLQLPTFVNVVVNEETGSATFTWNPELIFETYPGSDDDQVNIVCLIESIRYAVSLINSAKRSASTVTVDLKSEFKLPTKLNLDDIHFWFYLSTFDLMMNSDSVYVKK